jgi:hypothetical protein
MLVMTWNMQGAGGGFGGISNASDTLSFLRKGGGVLLLQEAGKCPWKLTPTNKNGVIVHTGYISLGKKIIGGARKNVHAFVVWYSPRDNTKAGHDRCSMAVIAVNYDSSFDVIPHHSKNLRPLIGIRTADGIWCYSIHAPSGNHKSAIGVAKSMMKNIKAEKFIVAGDFNCQAKKSGIDDKEICASKYSTHQGGNVLDYAVYKGVSVTLANSKVLDFSSFVSDHYSQSFFVQ